MNFILFSLLFFQGAFASESVIPKKLFLDEFKKGIPNSFCASGTYFRKCFELTEENCKAAVTAAATACIVASETEIPAQLQQPADGQAWGKKIGSCVGGKFETDLAKSKLTAADCKDPTKWQ